MRRVLYSAAMLALLACTNNPYRAAEEGRNTLYSSFAEEPKHFDPAISYSSDQYVFITQIYEPVLQYHFLKRPYELIPLTAAQVPKPQYLDKEGRPLPDDAPTDQVARAVYTIRIKPGIRYQNHPCFAKDSSGNPLYFDLKDADVQGYESAENFPQKDTRELVAADYVWQIKRLAHPILQCPIASTLQTYVDGFDELGEAMGKEVDRVRAERKKEAGALYNQEKDELEHPIFLDMDAFEFRGAKTIDATTFQIVLKTKYPQMRYWLAMPFFSPVPREADRFYAQGPLVSRRITLDTNPIGTGPYRLERFAPNEEIVLTRNENFHGEAYPTEGDPGDREEGYLKDAGRPMPFIDKAVYKRETEAIPRWGKFQQGYFDYSLIISDVFDQAVTITTGGIALSESMKERGIQLVTEAQPTIYYYAFNMLDETVGGFTPEKQKLRQAIAIALDMEEYIQIFENGRDMSSYGPLPPGIFGFSQGRESVNLAVYDWDERAGKPRRKSIETAKKLLSEAGYPNGRDRNGKPLVIYYDNALAGAESKTQLDWMRKQAAKIDIDLESRTTDYNRFQDKAQKGNFQLLSWGWIADYPDPENFLFLLYGPNSKVKFGGENAANYDQPDYNALFKKMSTMDNGPQRLELIRTMVRRVQEDTPWIPQYFPVEYTLYHPWYSNTKPMTVGGGTLKYRRIDPQLRARLRNQWNRPVYAPLLILIPLLLIAIVPAVVGVIRRQRRSALA